MNEKVFEVFFDGECPLCLKEINMIRRMDKENKLIFTDIAAADFKPEDYNLSFEEFMAEIHGRFPDGTMITGVEVFRQLYGAVGFKGITDFTRIPGIKGSLDIAYKFFAKNRLKFTGRCIDPDKCKV